MARSRLTPLLALPIAVSLLLGIAPGPAQGELCKKRNLSNGCVDSADVQDDSLGLIELKDEAGFHFTGANNKILNQLSSTNTVFSRAFQEAPRKGWVVATANVWIQAESSPAKGSVRCDITATQPPKGTGGPIAQKPFFDSVALASDVKSATMNATMGFQVRKGDLLVKLSCRRLSGGGIRVKDVDFVVQYYPTRY